MEGRQPLGHLDFNQIFDGLDVRQQGMMRDFVAALCGENGTPRRDVAPSREEDDNDNDDPAGDDDVENSGAGSKRRRSNSTYTSRRVAAKTAHDTSQTCALGKTMDRRQDPCVLEQGRGRCRKRVSGATAANLAPGSEDECSDCKAHLELLLKLCHPSLRSNTAPSQRKGHGAYNLAELKPIIGAHAFDLCGNFLVHSKCLAKAFGVSSSYITGCHKYAIESRRRPLLRRPLSSLTKDQRDRVVIPVDLDMTLNQYLDTLAPEDEVQLTRGASEHGLIGKPSNRAAKQQMSRRLFKIFVQENRSPRGCTREDEHGRHHGAEFYLNTKFTVLREQANRRAQPAKDKIFTSAFLKHAKASVDEAKESTDLSVRAEAEAADIPKCHTTIESWFKADFGIGSPLGHTILHPKR